jgi:hypothetical protein
MWDLHANAHLHYTSGAVRLVASWVPIAEGLPAAPPIPPQYVRGRKRGEGRVYKEANFNYLLREHAIGTYIQNRVLRAIHEQEKKDASNIRIKVTYLPFLYLERN